MNSRFYRIILWVILVASGLLVAWQAFVFFTDGYPDHIMPLVLLLSGSEEAVPVAYSWTLRVGLLSVALFAGTGILLGLLHFSRKNMRREDP